MSLRMRNGVELHWQRNTATRPRHEITLYSPQRITLDVGRFISALASFGGEYACRVLINYFIRPAPPIKVAWTRHPALRDAPLWIGDARVNRDEIVPMIRWIVFNMKDVDPKSYLGRRWRREKLESKLVRLAVEVQLMDG